MKEKHAQQLLYAQCYLCKRGEGQGIEHRANSERSRNRAEMERQTDTDTEGERER